MSNEPLIQLKQKSWFLLVGGTAALIYLILATFLAESLNMEAWLASAISWTICIIPAYQGQKLLTFKSELDHKVAFPRYFISQIIGILLSSLLSFMLSRLTSLNALAIFSIVIFVVTTSSYFFQRFWVF